MFHCVAVLRAVGYDEEKRRCNEMQQITPRASAFCIDLGAKLIGFGVIVKMEVKADDVDGEVALKHGDEYVYSVVVKRGRIGSILHRFC